MIIDWFARHPTAANLFMAAIMILGLTTIGDLQRATFPEIEPDEVQVSIVYKGADAGEVEDAICLRIEDAIEGIIGLDEIRCEATEGRAVAVAVKREGADMGRFLDDVNAAIDGIDDFPDDIELPIVEERGRTDRVISVAVTGPDDPVALKAYAQDLKSRMQQSGGYADVTINGFSNHQIRIEVPSGRLRQYGLSAADVAEAIGRMSVGLPSGRIEGGYEDVLLRFDDQRKTVEEFRDLVVISGATGAAIRLGEVAKITDRFERDEEKILFDGKRAAILDIEKTRDQDILNVYAEVVDFIEAERARVPAGINLSLTQNFASIVQDRLQMLLRNGAQGLALVFAVLWLFFSFRYSFWVTMGLPVSFLGGLFVLGFLGMTINMISMVGLLIGIGLLMDDAIVIAENIAARRARGDSPMDAAVNGVSQVLPGVASSFATTLLVFGSLAFITGEIGQILRVMPIVLIVVLSVSLIEAFLILPSHLGHALAHGAEKQPGRLRQGFENGFDKLRERLFGPLLDRAVEQRYLTVGLIIMLLILAVAMPVGGFLKFVGFPDIEGDVVEARILLPQGTPLKRTEEVVERVVAAIEELNTRLTPEQPEGTPLVKHVIQIYGQNPDAYESGPHVARVVVDLLSAEERTTNLDDLISAWRAAVGSPADVITIKYTEPVIGPGGRPIDLRLIGPDLDELKAASLELQGWLNRYQGVEDLSDDLRPGKRELRLRLKDSAPPLGFDAAMVSNQIRAAFQGVKIDELPIGPEIYEVDLRLVADDRRGFGDIDDLVVTGRNGAQVPLSVVASVEETRGWARINRVDRQRAVTVQGDVDRNLANAAELLGIAGREFVPGLLERYPDLRFQVQGQSDESAKTGQSIVRNVLLGMFGVYLLLALQFRGYLAPITVMAVIPTAMIGVVFGHLAMGLDMTMPSIVGMASLFGVVVNDSILLVVFIREAHAHGMDVQEAAKRAGRARFRPILLTSITTVAGLLPLLLEKSMQAQILIPLAASLAFGLATATIAALFLVPAVYCVLADFGKHEPGDDA